MPFQCHYELDQRLDWDLVNLYQESYRFIKTAVGDTYKLRVDADGLPDGVQYFLLYIAALISGAADASLTLTLHNLGREARIRGRQIFEYWIRAEYYASNPDEAKALLLARDCNEVQLRYPGFVVHKEPKLRRLVGNKNDEVATKFYTFLYRIPSQALHATGAGIGTVPHNKVR